MMIADYDCGWLRSIAAVIDRSCRANTNARRAYLASLIVIVWSACRGIAIADPVGEIGAYKPAQIRNPAVAAAARNPDTQMPLVVGRSSQEAKDILTKAGLRYRYVGEVKGQRYADRIAAQSPDQGGPIRRGAVAELTRVREVNATVMTVPAITGMSVADARTRLHPAGLTMVELRGNSHDDAAKIVTQQPLASQPLPVNRQVFVTTIIPAKPPDYLQASAVAGPSGDTAPVANSAPAVNKAPGANYGKKQGRNNSRYASGGTASHAASTAVSNGSASTPSASPPQRDNVFPPPPPPSTFWDTLRAFPRWGWIGILAVCAGGAVLIRHLLKPVPTTVHVRVSFTWRPGLLAYRGKPPARALPGANVHLTVSTPTIRYHESPYSRSC